MSLLFFFDTHPEKGLFLMCDIWESRFCSLLYLPALGPLIKTWNVRLWLIYYASFTYALFSCCIFLLSPVFDVHLWRAGHDEYRALRVSECLWTWSSRRNEFVRLALWHTSYEHIHESPPKIQRSFLWVRWQADNNQCSVFGSWGLWILHGYNLTGAICDYLYRLPWVEESVFMRWNQTILSDEGNEKVQDSLPICSSHLKELSMAPADPSAISGLP